VSVLLDTHVFLWWIADDRRLSRRARRLLQDPRERRLLSTASLWEIALKVRAGKLRLGENPRGLLTSMLAAYGIETLPIQASHTLAVLDLPDHHKDPFDRLLIAQALGEGLRLLTNDDAIRRYAVSVIW
jgi:PIN domain nuclease of toxin-antitoxin system